MSGVGLLDAAAKVYEFVIIARALFSWLPPQHRENEVYRFLFAATEPVLAPLRRILPGTGGIDLSPLIAIILLEVIIRML